MRTKITLFIIALSTFAITQAYAADVVNLSLDPADWNNYDSSNTSYTKSLTPDGYLKFVSHAYRGYIHPKTAYTFNLQNATLRYKWRLNGLNQYCWTGDGPRGIGQMGPNLTTHHSWAGSIVISNNTWIYTQIVVNPDKSWSYNYSYTGYGLGGISQGSGVLSDTLWDYMAESYFHKLIADNYGINTYMEFAELVLIINDPIINDADIISPAANSYFGPGDSITFTGEEHGNVDPASFVWTSSLDGALGTGQTVESTLSVGTHTITLEYDDTEGGIGQRNITIHIITTPLIDDIPDAMISSANSYTGSVPVVSADSQPITWSLTQAPANMTIDVATGVVSWPSPQAVGSPHTVTIQADNPVGFDDESWQLDVLDPPVIAHIPDEMVTEYLTYTGPTPVLEQGTPPITWSLVQGPAGTSIDPTTGVVSWANAQPAFAPYTITIKATNAINSGNQTWQLTVLSPPVIGAIADGSANLGQPYTGPVPSLIKGTAPVTFSLDQGPGDMTINTSTGVVSWANPVADVSPYLITIGAANIYGSSQQSFNLTVIIPPVIDPLDDASIVEDTTYTRQMTLAEGTEPVQWVLTAAPVGMFINAAGLVSWPSVPGVVGPHTVTARASNSAGLDIETWQLTVLTIPVVDPIDNLSIIEGDPYTSVVPTLSKGTPPITWSLVSGPSGMTIDSDNGVVSWANPSAEASPYTITILATNAQGFDDESWQLNVIRPPVVSEIDDDWVAEGLTYTGPMPTLDDGTLPVTWSLAAGPTGMTINATTGVVSWPNVSSVGVHTVTIKADNLAGFDEESWQVEVLAIPEINSIADDSAVENTTYTGPVPTLLKGALPVSWSLVAGPASMTIDAGTGVVSWPNAVPSFTPYTITIRSTNIVGSDDEIWLLSVLSIPVIAEIPDASIMLGSQYSAQPTLIKGVPAVTWTLDAAPAGMSINPATGVVSWANPIPEGSINTITISATNSQGADNQSWQLKVMLPPQIDPIADDTVHEGSAYQMTPSLSQGTAPVTWTLLAAPPGVSVNPLTGVVSWPHVSGYNAPHTITLQATNDIGSHQQSWQLNVLRPPLINAIGDGLVAEDASYTGPVPTLYQGALPVTWSLETGPGGMSIDPETGIVSWPQALVTQSPHTITIAATNIVGSDTESWLLTVVQSPIINPVANATISSSVPYIGPQPTLSQGQYITWTLESSPIGMTINSSTGVVSWPNPQTDGSPHNVSIKATNIAGSDVTSWQLTVMDSPIIAAIPDTSATEMVPYAGPTPALLQGDGTIQWSLVQAPAGVTIDATTGVVSWSNPTVAGSPHLLTISAENIVGSDNESWQVTVPVSYTATVSTDIDLAPMGTTVLLQGHAYYLSSGDPTPNVPLEIFIEVQGMYRTINTTTDASGNFSEPFVPLPQEAGVYSIGADHPFGANDVIDDQFILVGMRSKPTRIRLQLLVGNPVTGSFQLANLGDTSLSGISAAVTDSPANIDLLIDEPNQLDPLTTADVNYTITALDSSITSGTVQIELTSAEGATAGFNMDIGVTPLTPQLKVYPESLSAGMIRGEQQTVQFEVFNTGAAPTPKLTVLIPDAPWLQLNGPEVIGIHEPNDVTVVSLNLIPADNLPLGPYSGTIIVYGTGMSQVIPFEFNCASDNVGDLEITAVDEFTYFAAGSPNIDDATVTLRDIIADTIIVSNMPMISGVLLLEDLPETYYSLEVNAPDHSSYSATVYVAPAVTSKVTAFLSRQVVKYVWTVEPTQIQDVYTVTLTTQYETNVPAPVVTIEPAKVDFAEMENGSMQVDFIITNHGLVAAEDFHLDFDDSDRYEITMLTDYNGTVGPNISLTIPVLITDTYYTPPESSDFSLHDSTEQTGQENCERLLGGGFYRVVCGDDGKWKHIPITMANWSCSLVETIVTILASDDPPDYDPQYNYKAESRPNDNPQESGSGKTTVSTTTSPSRGGVVVIEGNGGNHADRGKGTNQKRPYVTHTTIQISEDKGGGCDPCPRKRAEAVVDCAASFVLGCPLGVLKGLTDTISNCTGDTTSSYRCILTGVNAVVGGVAGCVTKLSPFGIGWNIAMCIEGIANACEGVTASGSQEAALNEYMSLTGEPIVSSLSDSEQDLQFLLEQNQRLITVMEALTEMLGDPIWFTGFPGEEQLLSDWLEAYWNAIDENGDGNEFITAGERDDLISMPLPSQITTEHINALCDRWNRTLNYWQAGIFKTEHVNPGDDTNFIDLDVLNQKWQAASDAMEASIDDGFEDIFGGVQVAMEQMQESDPTGQEGVCAKVKLEIQQSAVITRSAFKATLSMDNIGPDSLDNMSLTLEITDQLSNPSNDLFGIYPPTLFGISDLSGTGTLGPSSSMRAEWIIVPNSDAAPTEAVKYLVGGQINYSINGLDVSMPITPDIITVKPDPKLHVKYFQEYQVYADDPFTPEIEPSIPFSLGLMMTNSGAGTAYNVSISSAQPQIIRHEQDKDILVDFMLVGTQIGAQPVTPSLAVNLGHIQPGQTRLARWVMESSLQGEFTSYNASFEHVDTLGDPRLSLMESVEVHELIHAVRDDCPGDDQIIDFLVNDEPDPNSLPDTLYLSDGTIVPVTAITDVNLNELASEEDLEIEISVPAIPGGYIYVRIPDLGGGQLQLASVIRSDGKEIRIDDNAWLTDRSIHELGEEPYRETLLHIFDCDSTGLYTITYTTADQPLVVNDIDLMTDPVSTIEVTFSMPINESTFDWNDLTLTRNGGENLIYQPLAIRKVSETIFRISGLALLTATGGLYELTIDLGGIGDMDGNSGSGIASTSWLRDETPWDVNKNDCVDLKDFAILSANWQMNGCMLPFWCEGADVNKDGHVDLYDLEKVAEYWLDMCN